MKKTIITPVLSITLAVAGCSGTMQGVVRGEGTAVQFHYEQGVDRDYYTLVMGGETFKGQAVYADATTGFGWNTSTNASAIVTTTSGNMIATLFGDKGSTMRCNMNYADSTGFTTMGGVGACQHSNGKIIDVMW